MSKHWIISQPWSGRQKLANALGISPIVAQVLHNRGITEPAAARAFLDPRISDVYPPETMPATGPAAERIAAAVAHREKIVLFGDYDVDGITGVAILWHCLKLAGADVDFYIPHRLEEGYGVNTEAIDTLADAGTQLIVTVDCGVTAIDPARRAKQRGVDLIITDHHQPYANERGEVELPDALLVHAGIAPPGQPPYPNPDLSGAGVAFKLAWAIARHLSKAERVKPEFREFLIDAVALAALGIVADVVPLVGENRIIAHHGLKGLRHSRLPGIQALIHSAGLAGKKLDGYDLGFKLAPRLNAIGRMGHARLAVDLLTRAQPDEAVRIAENLESQNRARQLLQRRITKEATEQVVREKQGADTVRGIVLASQGWHAGIIGIVASRIVEEFGRPTVLIALEKGVGQGSARSIPNFPLHEVFADCREHLLSYGGHAMAAGLRIKAEKIDAFRTAFANRAGQLLTPTDLRAKLRIDDVVCLGDLNTQLVQDMNRLEPFGAGNPHARLATDWVNVIGEPRAVGSGGAHIQVNLGDGRARSKGIAFGMAKHQAALMDHRRCRVAFRPILNQWQGRTSVEVQVLDFQFPEK